MIPSLHKNALGLVVAFALEIGPWSLMFHFRTEQTMGSKRLRGFCPPPSPPILTTTVYSHTSNKRPTCAAVFTYALKFVSGSMTVKRKETVKLVNV